MENLEIVNKYTENGNSRKLKTSGKKLPTKSELNTFHSKNVVFHL